MVTVTPTILPGATLNLYKYEYFSYTFSILETGTLRYSKSSPQLNVYSTLSSDGTTFTFAGTPPASYSGTFSLVVELMNGTTVVSTTTYPVTISAGRITLLPVSPYALYQYENVSNTFGSNILWSSSNSPDSILSIPTLPYGLSFSNSYIVGVPQTQQPQRNYQLIASNSTNGSISTAAVAFSIGVPTVRITPTAATFAGLGIGSTPTATFTALVPFNPYLKTFNYSWSTLPSGLTFSKTNGQQYSSTDQTLSAEASTITLSGSPDMTDAFGFPSSGIVNVTLTGTYKDSTNVQTIGNSTLTFQFVETVLMSTSASSNLYVGRALGSNDVVVTASSYFPSTSGISNFTASGLPAGLTLVSNSPTYPTRWWLDGKPTTESTNTYTFTATSSNAITKSATLSIRINPDIVTFTSYPTNDILTSIVSRPLSKYGGFQLVASATSGETITYTSSIDLALYGLYLDSSTGLFSGTPTSVLESTPIVFTATDTLGASTTLSKNLLIQEDTFKWPGDAPYPAYAPTYFQNRSITPYQIVVYTTSERSIQSFTSTNMPPGLLLSPTGLITGIFTGLTGGTFTVTATTGYQAPSTASHTFSYSAIADNHLVLQVNGIDPITNSFSDIEFQTTQYSSSTRVNPVYTVTNTYPSMSNTIPNISVSSLGKMSGSFDVAPPAYSNYIADINATYAGATGKSTVVLSLSNTPTPFMLAGVKTAAPDCNVPKIFSTSSYVFTVDTSGTKVVSNQSWTSIFDSVSPRRSTHVYPDLGRIGTGFVSVTSSNVYDGTYNPTTNGVDWTNTMTSAGPRYACVANDGSNKWMVVQMSTPITMYTRSGNTGSWITRVGTFGTNDSGEATLGYVNSNFVFGQAGSSGTYCNVLYTVFPWNIWSVPAISPNFSNILRFATSNTTIVAVGHGAPAGVAPISYSSDAGVTWVMPTTGQSLFTGTDVVINDVIYVKDNAWYFCGNSNGTNFIGLSPNLITWDVYPHGPTDIRYSALAYNGNALTAAGSYSNTTQHNVESRIVTFEFGNDTPSISSDTMKVERTENSTILFSRILTAAFSNTSSFTGTVYIPQGPLSFTQPTQTSYILYKYVPYTIPVTAVGLSGFIYYYFTGIPIGFQAILDPTGTTATISGISPSNGTADVTVYAKTASLNASVYRVNLTTIIPYFMNPQSGAAAYTAILRDQVEANAAQNARDSQTFPQVDSLAGPFMGPRAPDVVTQSNCFLGLCKKPCPTCRTTL